MIDAGLVNEESGTTATVLHVMFPQKHSNKHQRDTFSLKKVEKPTTLAGQGGTVVICPPLRMHMGEPIH